MRTAAPPKLLFSGAHLLFEILDDRLEEAFGGQPVLVGADQQREVLGHLAALDRRDADLFEIFGEFGQRGIIVELAAVLEAAGPGKDRRDRVGRGRLALLVHPIMAGEDWKSTRLNSSHLSATRMPHSA